jgi:caffeoyl-CoA O-methyltransferase
MKDSWIDYAEQYTSGESTVLSELRQHCYENYSDSNMLSGYFQGRVLSMLSKMIRPRLVLEIGTYLGYSALCLAEGLAENGRLITLDVNEETNEVAKSFVERTEFAEAIEFRLGDALELIPAIEETPDLVFIDADKENYSNYYRLVMERLRPGGVIIADNVLWSGKVLENEKDASTLALYEFNKLVLEDARVSNVLLPIRDGLMVVRREA